MKEETVERNINDLVNINIRKKYWWLYIPMLSWIGLVFPLILPPIPLGPVMISLSWNRRDWMQHIQRGRKSIRRKKMEFEFPFGWLVNVIINLIDMATLGLSHLIVTAELLQSMIAQDGTEKERQQTAPIAWFLKWLAIGNIAFIAIYVICPGIIFEKILIRYENHLCNKNNIATENNTENLLEDKIIIPERITENTLQTCY